MKQKYLRRISNINDTRIRYIKVLDKLYEVDNISFYYFTVNARQTDKTIDDVPANEVFDITDFPEFLVTLHNWQGKVIDFVEYVKNRKSES